VTKADFCGVRVATLKDVASNYKMLAGRSGAQRVGFCSNAYECARVGLYVNVYTQEATTYVIGLNSHGSGCDGDDIAGWLVRDGKGASVWVVTDAAWQPPDGITLYGAVQKNDYYKNINRF